MRFIRLFVLSLSLLAASITLQAQDAAQFRAAAEAALAAYDVPGFSVGIIKDGEIVLAEGFGTRTVGKDQPVDEHTLFAIASNTKAFVSSSLVKLALEEKLSLNDYVVDHLPYFRLYDDYVTRHMQIKDLLCHRAGLGTFSGDVVWYKSDLDAEQVLRQIRHLPQAYEWRNGYGYSNLMFITAGEVIKAVTGQTWAEYVQESFLNPLDMDRTQTSVTPLAQLDNVATPHISRNNNQPIPYAIWDNMGAAGGVVSSSHDMLQWIDAQLKNNKTEEGVLPKGLTRRTWTPANPLGTSETFTSAGLGWFITTIDGERIVSHGGGYDGMYSQVKLVPDQDLGIVILTNGMTGLASRLSSYIVDSYLGRETDAWLEKAIEREDQSRKSWNERRTEREDARVLDALPSVSAKQLVGTYHDPLFGNIQITTADDNLRLIFETAKHLNATLTHWHYDTYLINWDEPHAWFDFGTIRFVIDNNRTVTGIRFDVPNDDIFFDEIEAEREE